MIANIRELNLDDLKTVSGGAKAPSSSSTLTTSINVSLSASKPVAPTSTTTSFQRLTSLV